MTKLKDIAKMLGVSRNTIYNIVERVGTTINNLSCGKEGRAFVFDDQTVCKINDLYNSEKEKEEERILCIVGQRFGRLLVERYIGKIDTQNRYLCICDCGNKTEVSYHELISGAKKSCGCLRRDVQQVIHTKHGDSHKRLYKIYRGMLSRCYNTNQETYRRYWGRGIVVCDEWHDYDVFREWALSHGYNDDLTIDRIDNSKGYSPDNCRWIPSSQQAANQTTNKIITIDGVSHIMSEWCRVYGINPGTVWHRIDDGWDPVKAITTPLISKTHMITYNGKTQSIRDWSEETGIPLNTLRLRFHSKWPVEKMLTQPHQVKHRRL